MNGEVTKLQSRGRSYQDKFFSSLKEQLITNGVVSHPYNDQSGAVRLAKNLGDFISLMGKRDGDRIVESSYAMLFEEIYSDQDVIMDEKDWKRQVQLGRDKLKKTYNHER